MSPDACPVRGIRTLEDQDPYPYFAATRDDRPAYWDDTMKGLVLLRYEDCQRVLNDEEGFPMPWSLLRGGQTALGRYGAFNLTGEAHATMHDVLLAWFNPRRNETLRPMVEQVVTSVFDRVTDLQSWEFGAEVADVVPGLMALRFLGLPDDDETIFALVHRANTALQRFMQSHGDDDAALAELEEGKREIEPVFLPAIRERRAKGGDDLISLLWQQAADYPDWDEQEMLSQCLFFFGASYGNTANALTSIAYCLLADPALPAALTKDDFRAVPAFVDEAMRVWSPVQFRIRIAAADCEVAGVTVSAGTRILPIIASANRDPQRYPEPDVIDVSRAGIRRHLVFGSGTRYCVGATLARLEAEVVVRQLLARCGNFEPSRDAATAGFGGLNYRSFRPLVFVRKPSRGRAVPRR